MKAYILQMNNDPDAGMLVVFANTAREAKNQAIGQDFYEMSGEWLELRVNRAPQFDGLEGLSNAELALRQWREGWRWYDQHYPDPDEATDKEFLHWYGETFGDAKTI